MGFCVNLEHEDSASVARSMFAIQDMLNLGSERAAEAQPGMAWHSRDQDNVAFDSSATCLTPAPYFLPYMGAGQAYRKRSKSCAAMKALKDGFLIQCTISGLLNPMLASAKPRWSRDKYLLIL
jgi:hypothetical protein